jgi:glycosyltransferase involved in cell wall biosynthesis
MLVSVPMPPQEGIGTYAHSLAIELVKRGHIPTVITRAGGPQSHAFDVAGVPIVELPFIRAYPFHVHLHGIFVRRYLRRNASRFDVVHAHSPLVPTLDESWRVVTTVHSLLGADAKATKVDDLMSALIRLQTPISAQLERRLLRQSAAIAAVNPEAVPAISNEVRGQIPISVHFNAVDQNWFVPDPAPRGPRHILSVGRLAHGKGYEDLLEAWRQVIAAFSDARLTIVGDGPLRGRLSALVAAGDMSTSVEFLGTLRRDQRERLRTLYQHAAAVVQPSHHEGLSTVVLEAMACATPVIATNVGAHGSVITDGINGRLVAPAQPEGLARAITEIIENPALARQLGTRARATVLESFTWGTVADSYVSLYEKVLRGARR